MMRRRESRRGAALLFALLAVVVVSGAAVVLQARSEETIRRRRTDRAVTLARLRAESAVETFRAALASDASPCAAGTAGATTTRAERRPDGTLIVTAIGVVESPVAASFRLEVTLRPVAGGLPEIVAWDEPAGPSASE